MSIQPGSTITSEQRGYRRGLILGLTMAESMLLLVFCLLLAAGAIIVNERKKLDDSIAERALIDDQLKTAETARKLAEDSWKAAEDALLTLQEQLSQIPQLERRPIEDWNRLIEAQNQLQKLEDSELHLTDVIEHAEVVKTVIAKKLTTEDLTRAERVIETLTTIKSDKSIPSQDELEEIVLATRRIIAHAEASDASITDALDEALRRASLYVESDGTDEPHKWPPIINLSEADKYSFRSGSAELSQNFEEMLVDAIAPQIAATATSYNVDIIEVIGHTDEQRMGKRPSNLDDEIKNVLSGDAEPLVLQPADNAGLGLARAIAVAEVLKRVQSLQNFTILPMSAAQLTMPGDQLTDGYQSGNVASRRRIEVRVRKRNAIQNPVERAEASN